jgi:hypothetical protein
MKVYSANGWTNAGSSVNGTTNRYSYTATAGQTVFAATYDAGYVDVFLNGVKQVIGSTKDVTATTGTSIVFNSATSVNDVVDIIGYGTFVLADHLTQAQSDARYVNLSGDTMTGALDVQGTITSDGLTVDGGAVISNSNFDTLYLRRPSTASATFIMENSNNNGGSLQADDNGLRLYTRTASSFDERLRLASNGDISFYDDSNNAKFFWGASAESLTVEGFIETPYISLGNTGNSYQTVTGSSDGNDLTYRAYQNHIFKNTTGASSSTDGTERMRIKDGDVFIGPAATGTTQRLFAGTGTSVGQGLAGFTWSYDDRSSLGLQIRTDSTFSSSYPITFATTGSSDMTLDTSGNLLVGTTDDQPPTNSDVSGIALRSDGKVAASRNNGIAADFNNNSEGNIVWFRKNGSVVATVSTRTGGGDAPYFGGYTNADTGIAFSSARMYPVTSSGVVANGTRDLGNTDARWGNLWLAGGVYLGGTGSANKLDDYEEGTFNAQLLNVTHTLNGSSCKYTKIGRIVHIFGNIDVTSLDTSDGSSLTVGNLPFAASNDGFSHGTFVRGYNKDELFPSSTATDVTGINVTVSNSLNFNRGTGTGTNPFVTYTLLNSSGEFSFGVTYTTNS